MTPSSISLMMTLLDSSNSDCISSFHVNVVPGFKSARNGSILSAAANAYATWLTSPNHDRSYVSDVCWCRKVQDRFEEFSGWAYTGWRIQRYPARIQICSTLFHCFRTTVAIPLPGGMLL